MFTVSHKDIHPQLEIVPEKKSIYQFFRFYLVTNAALHVFND